VARRRRERRELAVRALIGLATAGKKPWRGENNRRWLLSTKSIVLSEGRMNVALRRR
jgi:hypothetical protein